MPGVEHRPATPLGLLDDGKHLAALLVAQQQLFVVAGKAGGGKELHAHPVLPGEAQDFRHLVRVFTVEVAPDDHLPAVAAVLVQSGDHAFEQPGAAPQPVVSGPDTFQRQQQPLGVGPDLRRPFLQAGARGAHHRSHAVTTGPVQPGRQLLHQQRLAAPDHVHGHGGPLGLVEQGQALVAGDGVVVVGLLQPGIAETTAAITASGGLVVEDHRPPRKQHGTQGAGYLSRAHRPQHSPGPPAAPGPVSSTGGGIF